MAKGNRASGFSLLELLAVIAIIGIVVGMVGAVAQNARQRSYDARASAEVQQIALAFKAYWVANGKWPEGFGDGVAASGVELSKNVLESSGLIGGVNSGNQVYLDLSADSFQPGPSGGDTLYFIDPWGHPYVVTIGDVTETAEIERHRALVRPVNTTRYYYND